MFDPTEQMLLQRRQVTRRTFPDGQDITTIFGRCGRVGRFESQLSLDTNENDRRNRLADIGDNHTRRNILSHIHASNLSIAITHISPTTYTHPRSLTRHTFDVLNDA